MFDTVAYILSIYCNCLIFLCYTTYHAQTWRQQAPCPTLFGVHAKTNLAFLHFKYFQSQLFCVHSKINLTYFHFTYFPILPLK